MPAAASGSISILRKGHACWATLKMKVCSRRLFYFFLFLFFSPYGQKYAVDKLSGTIIVYRLHAADEILTQDQHKSSHTYFKAMFLARASK